MQKLGGAGTIAILLALQPVQSVASDQLDLDAREFTYTWRQAGAGNKITFNSSKRQFGTEFSGKYLMFNTSDGSYSRCDAGRDGGANLCVSGRLFDCAFFVTMSTGNIANLS